MSGVEAASAVIGLITGIIAAIETIQSISSAIQDARGLPKAFAEVARRLPLARSTLKTLEEHCQKPDVDKESLQALKSVLEDSQKKIESLEAIFRKVEPPPDASRLQRYRSAARTVGKGSRVESLMKGLLENIQLLAGDQGIKAATNDELESLANAITELSAIPPSLPEEDSTNLSHFGTGDNNYAEGDIIKGNQNNYSGSGAAYFGSVTNQVFRENPTRKILQALKPIPERNRLLSIEKWTKETCKWLVEDPEFLKWSGSENSEILWVSGGPGKGKTILATYVIKHLQQTPNEKVDLLYFFCNSRKPNCNTTDAVLMDLSHQLLQRQKHLVDHIDDYFTDSSEPGCPSTFQVTPATVFETLLRYSDRSVFCLLDGLDECENSERNLDAFLEVVTKLALERGSPSLNGRFKLLILSRDQPECIQRLLHGFPRIDLEGDRGSYVKADVDKFIAAKVNELASQPKKLSAARLERVKRALVEKADGTFLWAGYVADDLKDKTWTEIEGILSDIPLALDGLYRRMFLQIKHRLKLKTEKVGLLFTWVVLATCPLTLEQLAAVVKTDGSSGKKFANSSGGMSEDLSDNIAEDTVADVVTVCGRLFKLEGKDQVQSSHQRFRDYLGLGDDGLDAYRLQKKQGLDWKSEVHFVHQSVKDYLQMDSLDEELEAFRVDEKKSHSLLANACLKILEEEFSTSLAGQEKAQQRSDLLPKPTSPLLNYAMDNWSVHLKYALEAAEDSCDLTRAFWNDPRTLDRWRSLKFFPRSRPAPSTPMHFAAYYDVPFLARSLVPRRKWYHALMLTGNPCNIRDANLRTPLHFAAWEGSQQMVEWLLNNGADVNAQDKEGDTSLHGAVARGDKSVVLLLLRSKADPNRKNKRGLTPLVNAIDGRSNDILRTLLKHGSNPNYIWRIPPPSDDSKYASTNWYDDDFYQDHNTRAVKASHRMTPERLERTPLTYAGEHGLSGDYKTLLEFGAKPDLTSYIPVRLKTRPRG